MRKVGPGTLKCAIVGEGIDVVLEALSERIGADNVRALGAGAVLIHTDLETSKLRDWLSGHLRSGQSVLVLEFEKWSGYGEAIDREWLLARGH